MDPNPFLLVASKGEQSESNQPLSVAPVLIYQLTAVRAFLRGRVANLLHLFMQ
jgi:hypothetical protein